MQNVVLTGIERLAQRLEGRSVVVDAEDGSGHARSRWEDLSDGTSLDWMGRWEETNPSRYPTETAIAAD
jgi:hypothetical protein